MTHNNDDRQKNWSIKKVGVGALLVIVGATASGKSKLALELAQKLNGEIICADSMTVRQGADIGSAKPSEDDRVMVSHHLIDVVRPNEAFTAAQFKLLAQTAITDVHNRGKLPIMVGGTGLYIDSVLYDYEFLPSTNPEDRERLNQLTNEQLLQEINELGLDLGGVDINNNRRLIRLIETDGARPTRHKLRANTYIVGLESDRDQLKSGIEQRIDDMLADGLEGEVDGLAKRFGWDCEALKGVGYSQWRGYFLGTQSLHETRNSIVKATQDLSKRQRTWFKRNKSIHWLLTPVKWQDVAVFVTTNLEL